MIALSSAYMFEFRNLPSKPPAVRREDAIIISEEQRERTRPSEHCCASIDGLSSISLPFVSLSPVSMSVLHAVASGSYAHCFLSAVYVVCSISDSHISCFYVCCARCSFGL